MQRNRTIISPPQHVVLGHCSRPQYLLERFAEDVMRIKLLRVKTVSPDQQILDRFRSPYAIGNKRIVKNPITAGDHVRSRRLVGVLDGRADVTINMAKGDAPLLL